MLKMRKMRNKDDLASTEVSEKVMILKCSNPKCQALISWPTCRGRPTHRVFCSTKCGIEVM